MSDHDERGAFTRTSIQRAVRQGAKEDVVNIKKRLEVLGVDYEIVDAIAEGQLAVDFRQHFKSLLAKMEDLVQKALKPK